MPARRILQLGDPMLWAVSTPVSGFGESAAIFADLRDTLDEFRRTHGFGRGISAVQIGEPKRLIYIEFEGTAYHLQNPVWRRQSDEKFRLWDDCFSFPNLLVRVERAVSVAVEYETEEGPRMLEASGPLSELLQHEMDHLDGILAVDRAIDRKSFSTREEWQRLIQRASDPGISYIHLTGDELDRELQAGRRA
jgi:peptide deformylase